MFYKSIRSSFPESEFPFSKSQVVFRNALFWNHNSNANRIDPFLIFKITKKSIQMDKSKTHLTRQQAYAYNLVIFELFRVVLRDSKAADRELRKFFRLNKKFGSNDRRFISETLFSIFRWWGWLSQFIPSKDVFLASNYERIKDSNEWLIVLVAANLLDSSELHPVATYWKSCLQKKLKLPPYLEGLLAKKLKERGISLTHIFGMDKLSWKALIPSWAMDAISKNIQDQISMMETFQCRPPIWIRAQCKEISALIEILRSHGLDVHRSSNLKNAICLRNPRVNLYEISEFRNGLFEIQDLASQIIGDSCKAKQKERWWDVCAGAGGKSLLLASAMNNRGSVIATDIRPWKLEQLRKRAKRSQFSNISVRPNWNGKGIPAKVANFDGVLVDAPCSGTGTWRRNPDARWTMKQEDLLEFPSLQYNILKNASMGVKPGGSLVYATCSMCSCENEDVIEKFLHNTNSFELDPILHPQTRNQTDGLVYVWPQYEDTDITFTARMKRKK